MSHRWRCIACALNVADTEKCRIHTDSCLYVVWVLTLVTTRMAARRYYFVLRSLDTHYCLRVGDNYAVTVGALVRLSHLSMM